MKTVFLFAFSFLLYVCILTGLSRADATLSVGIGKNVMKQNGTPFERMVAVGYEHRFPIGVFVRPEVGYFLDISGQYKSSFWAAPLVGVTAVSQVGPSLHLAVGPGYLQNPDEILGGHFQFSLEGGIGLTDKNFFVGMVWKHLSSGGINMPNNGRDFICVQTRLLF